MGCIFTDHVLKRMNERGVTQYEVIRTVSNGVREPGRDGQIIFNLVFGCDIQKGTKHFKNKRVISITEQNGNDWKIITVVAKYF